MEWLKKCLDSVSASSQKMDVFVVDNGSSDGSLDYVRSCYPWCIVSENRLNLGFGKANNIGLQYAIDYEYDFVYLLNQDAWIFPETITQLIEQNLKDPSFGILSPVQVEANLKKIDSNFLSLAFSKKSNSAIFSDLFFDKRKPVYEVQGAQAAHWLISRQCLCDVGGFSPTFPHYGEDMNYIERCVLFGYKVGVVMSAIAVHDRENRKSTQKQRIYRGYIGTLMKISSFTTKRAIFLSVVYRTVRMILEERNVKPLVYLLKVLWNIREIKKNKERTKEKGAFLNIASSEQKNEI